jgi:hypothetical protein
VSGQLLPRSWPHPFHIPAGTPARIGRLKGGARIAARMESPMGNYIISNDELALMVDIAQNSPITMTPRKQERLNRLLAKNFIEPRQHGDDLGSGGYALTTKGETELANQGVGANES